jgi:hypothetical protein
MTTFINLTPHAVMLYDASKTTILATYPSVGSLRLGETIVASQSITPIVQVVIKGYSADSPVPKPKADTYYIVSPMISDHYKRIDFIYPDTGPDSVVRTKEGVIIGVTRFALTKIDDSSDDEDYNSNDYAPFIPGPCLA